MLLAALPHARISPRRGIVKSANQMQLVSRSRQRQCKGCSHEARAPISERATGKVGRSLPMAQAVTANERRELRSAPQMRARRFTPAEKFSAHIQFISSGPTVLGAGPRWADQINRSNETTKTTPQITTIFSASTSISVPDARENA